MIYSIAFLMITINKKGSAKTAEPEPVAEAFVHYISDVFDESDNMSDSELRRKMNYGYKQVLDRACKIKCVS